MNTTQNPVVPFNFHNKQIRVVMLEGVPWFVSADVMAMLYGQSSGHSHRYDVLGATEALKVTPSQYGLGRGRSSMLLSESGLYKLIMRSDKPEAKAFQDWVTKEVLPSIRKTGSYVTGQPSIQENPKMDPLDLMMAQAQLLPKMIEQMREQQWMINEQNARLSQQERVIATQVMETEQVKVRMEDILNQMCVQDFIRTKKLFKMSHGDRCRLGKQAAEISRPNDWPIKVHPFNGSNTYARKALEMAYEELFPT
jgi:prophage antirepressor-like protein